MKAIRTKFHPASGKKSARITATHCDGKKLTRSGMKDRWVDHKWVADLLRMKMGFTASLYGGQLDRSGDHVWLPERKA